MKPNILYKSIFITLGLMQSLFAQNLMITPPNPLTTDEDGLAIFSMVLNAQPAEDVYVKCRSSNLYEAQCPGRIVFTPSNWDFTQTFSVSGVNDYKIDGTQDYELTFLYSNLHDIDADFSAVETFSMQSIDVNTEPVVVNPNELLVTTESGGIDTFTVVLQQLPTADVNISISSSNTSMGTVDKTLLTFSTANWNKPQTVTITGVDDDGTIGGLNSYAIDIGVAVSQDPFFNNYNAPDLSVINLDNDSETLKIVAVTNNVTSEAGGSVQLEVSFNGEVSMNRTVFISTDASEAAVSPPTMTFTALDWNQTQLLTVTGEDDNITDGNVSYQISMAVLGLSTHTFDMINIDDEVGAIGEAVIITPIDTNLSEDGDTASFSVVCGYDPVSPFTLPFTITQGTQTTISPSSILFFDSGNWNVPQVVTISAVDDTVYEGTQTYIVEFPKPTTDPETEYNKQRESIVLTNYDNDTYIPVDILVSTGTTQTSESGQSVSLSVELSQEPTQDMKVEIRSSDASEGRVSNPSSGYLHFSADDWNSSKQVVITGVDDEIVDGTVGYRISLRSEFSTSSDTITSNTLVSKYVQLSNSDNDSASTEEGDNIIVIDDTLAQEFEIESEVLDDGSVVNSAFVGEKSLEAKQDSNGTTEITLDSGEDEVKIESELPNAEVHFFKDDNSEPGIRTVIKSDDNSSEIEIVANANATASYSMQKDGVSTKVAIDLPGAKIEVDKEGSVKTTYSNKKDECTESYTQVEIITLSSGETKSTFMTYDCQDNLISSKETLSGDKQFPHGSSTTIKKDENGQIVVEVVMDLNEELSFKEEL